MSTVSDPEHPFITAFRTRDLEAWTAHFAPDIKLHSPLVTSPFEGMASAVELYEVLFATLADVNVVFHATQGGVDAFHWRCRVDGRTIEGVDLVSYSGDGRISEIRVMIRTLPSLAAFALAVGPPLARRRGWYLGVIAYALTYPLKPLFAIVDAIAPRLIK